MWPFPDAEVRGLAAKAGRVLVPEMNLGQMVLEVRRAVGDLAAVHALNKTNGLGITPAEILDRIKEVCKTL